MRPNLTTQRDTRQAAQQDEDHRVYVNLHHLLRLRHQATGYSFLPQQPVHSVLAGRHASRLRGRGLNFEEIRRYLPGDDVRTIDWKVTARMRKAHVRVYTEERDRAMLLLIDQRLHMFFGTRDRMKSVVAAECAALGAWRALDSGDRVGALVFNDDQIEEIRPRRSQGTVMAILHAVENMNRALRVDTPTPSNAGQLNAALEMAKRLAKHDTLIVIVSDFQGIDAKTTRLTAQLAAHNDVLGLLMFDPVRAAPRRTDTRGVVTDGTRRLGVDFNDTDFLDKIATDYRDESEAIRVALRKLSAPLLPISTEGEVVQQIRALMGARAR